MWKAFSEGWISLQKHQSRLAIITFDSWSRHLCFSAIFFFFRVFGMRTRASVWWRLSARWTQSSVKKLSPDMSGMEIKAGWFHTKSSGTPIRHVACSTASLPWNNRETYLCHQSANVSVIDWVKTLRWSLFDATMKLHTEEGEREVICSDLIKEAVLVWTSLKLISVIYRSSSRCQNEPKRQRFVSGMIKEDFISVKRKIYKKLEAAASRTSASINVSALSKPALLCGILIGQKTLFCSEEIQCDKDAAAAVFRSPATDYRHQSIYSSLHYCHMGGQHSEWTAESVSANELVDLSSHLNSSFP